MPNHVTTRVELIGDLKEINQVFEKYNTYHKAKISKAYDGKAICKDLNSDKFSVGWMDLNTGLFHARDAKPIKGLPEGWGIELEDAFDHFPDFKKVIPPPKIDDYEASADTSMMNNPNNWYNWNRNNWGTKWNSYACKRINLTTFEFQTAWSTVPKIIEAMSKEFLNVEFKCIFADEDTGYNCGKFTFKGGKIVREVCPKGGTKESYEIAFEVHPDIKQYYELLENNYKYIDED